MNGFASKIRVPALAVAAVLAVGLGAGCSASSVATTPTVGETSASAPAEQTPMQQLKAAITEEVPGAKIVKSDGQITVTFPMTDNLTADMRRLGAQMDTTAILEAIHNSDVKSKVVLINMTAEMVDQKGNVSVDQVVSVAYTTDSLSEINFDMFDPANVWDIADIESYIHPELEG